MLLHFNVGAQSFVEQPTNGPGSNDYKFDSVLFKYVEGSKTSQDYWLFEPAKIGEKVV